MTIDEEEFQRVDRGGFSPKTQFFQRLRHSSSSISLPSNGSPDSENASSHSFFAEGRRSLRVKRAASQLFLSRRSSMDVPREIQISETTALLDNQSQSLSYQVHGASVLSIPSRDAERRRPPMRQIFWVIAAILISLMAIFSLLLLIIQPLSHVQRALVQFVDARPNFYGIHMTLKAQNSNIIKVVIQDADLDILASAGKYPIT